MLVFNVVFSHDEFVFLINIHKTPQQKRVTVIDLKLQLKRKKLIKNKKLFLNLLYEA